MNNAIESHDWWLSVYRICTARLRQMTKGTFRCETWSRTFRYRRQKSGCFFKPITINKILGVGSCHFLMSKKCTYETTWVHFCIWWLRHSACLLTHGHWVIHRLTPKCRQAKSIDQAKTTMRANTMTQANDLTLEFSQCHSSMTSVCRSLDNIFSLIKVDFHHFSDTFALSGSGGR